MTDVIQRLNDVLEGRYRIERKLGQGGMATVYLAADLRHDRPVALKVLKPELAAMLGGERFLAEIRTTANLQHPHILPLFDSGEADGFLFYVMPLVEGESLRERLDRDHQLPVEEALRIATDMAEALGYAHRHGVIHRDIKPGNVLIHDGQPLIADFGIALAVGVAGGGRLTETGLSLGTPHYMSPEQATGDQTVSAATDIYSLGCVLYEMLTGEPPYTGSTPQAVLGRIITSEPEPVTVQRKSVPLNVEAAISMALEKVPADRFAAAENFARALSDPGFRHGVPSGIAADSGSWKRFGLAGWAAAAVLAAVTAWLLLQPVSDPPHVTRFSFGPPGDATFAGRVHNGLAISPDGRTIVFADLASGLLYRREVGQLQSLPIPGTELAWFPFFSPDGDWLGFFARADNTLRKVRLDGTEMQTLAEVPASGRSAGWTRDGWIVLASSALKGLWRVPEAGGELQPIDTTGLGISWMGLLPGGHAVIGTNRGTDEIVAVRLDTAERIPLWTGRTPRYVSTGHVVFSRDDALWAVPFDPQALRATGEPVPIARGVLSDFNRFTRFAVAPELLVYQQTGGADPATRTVAWVERDGTPESLALPSGVYEWPRLSPDGSKLAIVRETDEGNRDIWIKDFVSGSFSPFTFHPADDYSPIWTPDGQRIVFGSWRSTDGSLFWRAADGSGSVEPVLEKPATQIPNGWTADGRLVFTEWTDPGYRLFVTRLDGSSEPEPLLADGFSKRNAALSPDGDLIAYESDELGPTEIFVRSFPALAAQRLLSTVDVTPASGVRVTAGLEGVGHRPVWSRDGIEVYYQNQDALLSVRLSADGTSFGAPDILFQGSYFGNSFGPHFDVAPDGRFVMILTGYGVAALSADAFTNELVVVQNWLEEVRPVIER